MGSDAEWGPYVTKSERDARVRAYLARRKKDGMPASPVVVERRTIAASFWGRSWCQHLESYADFDSRLARGRTYVRNGSIVDLRIEKGTVTAVVMGSELYLVTIQVAALSPDRWASLVKEHASQVSSVVELLLGKLPNSLLKSLADSGSGLFPPPKEMDFKCTCPDFARMCKHIAAALYAVGARLDDRPELFFVLRGVEVSELTSQPGTENFLDDDSDDFSDDELGALFGIELASDSGKDG